MAPISLEASNAKAIFKEDDEATLEEGAKAAAEARRERARARNIVYLLSTY